MIKVQDWVASIPEEEKHIAYVGEGMSEQREFLLCGEGWEKYKTWSFHLDMAFDPESITTRDSRQVVQTSVDSTKHMEETGVTLAEVTTKETYTVNNVKVDNYDLTDIASLDKTIEENGIRLTWTVLGQHTLLAGKLWATIRAVGAEPRCIKKSAIMVFEVEPAICAVPAAMPPVSEFEQMEAEMDALRQQALNAADSAMNSSVSAALWAEGVVQVQQKAADAAESAAASSSAAATAAQSAAGSQAQADNAATTAMDHAKRAEYFCEQAATVEERVITAYTNARHYAEVATENAETSTVNAEASRQSALTATDNAKAADTAAARAEQAALRAELLVSLADEDSVDKTVQDTLVCLTDAVENTPIHVVAETDSVFVVGKNWCPTDTVTFTHSTVVEMPLTLPAGTYRVSAVLSFSPESTQTVSLIQVLDENGKTVCSNPSLSSIYNRPNNTFTAASPFCRLRFFAGNNNSNAMGQTATLSELMLVVKGVSDDVFEEYHGRFFNPATESLTVTEQPMYLLSVDGSPLLVQYTIPTSTDYYLVDGYLDNKIARINDLIKQSAVCGDAFVFVTDSHTENISGTLTSKNAGNTPRLVRHISKNTPIKQMFVGGDMAVGASDTYAAALAKAFDGEIHYVMGNHDYDNRTTEGQLYYVYDLGKSNQQGYAPRHYYYVDNPQQKLRYIVINGFTTGSGATIDLAEGGDELLWLERQALQVEEGWGILLFSHQFFNRDWGGAGTRYISATYRPLQTVLDTYTGAGEILAVFHGHIHQDMVNRTPGGIPVIATACDKWYGTADELLTERTVGTVTEQAFDVVVVDRQAGNIHCVRIGAPARDGAGWIDDPTVEERIIPIRET